MFQRVKYIGKLGKVEAVEYAGDGDGFRITRYECGPVIFASGGETKRISRKNAAEILIALRAARKAT